RSRSTSRGSAPQSCRARRSSSSGRAACGWSSLPRPCSRAGTARRRRKGRRRARRRGTAPSSSRSGAACCGSCCASFPGSEPPQPSVRSRRTHLLRASLPMRARLELRAARAGRSLTVGANCLCDRLDVLQELLPGRSGALLVLLDALDRVRDRGLDVALVRAEDLLLQAHRRGPEDLPDRGVAEEGVLEAQDSLALEERRLARQVPGLLEDVRLGG